MTTTQTSPRPAAKALADRLRAAQRFGENLAADAADQPHAFVDDDGDGDCDVCGMTEEQHSTMDAETQTLKGGPKHAFVDKGDTGKCDTCGMPKEMHKGYSADGDCVDCGDMIILDATPEMIEGIQAAAATGVAEPIEIDPKNPGRFRAVLAVEDERTADNRIITGGAIKWRTPPLPLMLMTKTADGHDGAEIAGVIETITREDNKVIGEGRFDTGNAGIEAARLVANKVLTGVSIDAGDVEGSIEVEAVDESGEPLAVLAKMTSLTILGATVCPMQAIGSAGIEYVVALASDSIEGAESLDFEALATEAITYSVSASKSLPLSERDSAWDAAAADQRVRDWAGAEDAPNAKYGQAFFWQEGDGTNFGDYHLPFADVIGGKLVAIWKGVTAAAGAVQGSRGASLPYADQVKGAIAGYYTKATKVFSDKSLMPPWEAATEVLTAAGPILYAATLFADPTFDAPTPITVEPTGDEGEWRVYGHAAIWGTCHIGFPNTCVTPPKSRTNYSHFLTGSLPLDGGGFQPVGTITLNTNHPTERPYNAREAAMHYDHTGTAAAFVNVGEDEHGIWVSGVLKPGLDEAEATILAASSLSGDWRRIGGNLELVALLSVNTPGFPVAYTRDNEQVALVAAGYGHIKPMHSWAFLATEAREAADAALARVREQDNEIAQLREQVEVLARLVEPISRDRIRERLEASVVSD